MESEQEDISRERREELFHEFRAAVEGGDDKALSDWFFTLTPIEKRLVLSVSDKMQAKHVEHLMRPR